MDKFENKEDNFENVQRLIEIGKATECAFMNFEEFGMSFPFEIGNVNQLLEWYENLT
jgi:hypothetical protein